MQILSLTLQKKSEVDNINRLKTVITKLQSIQEVISVKRIQGTSNTKTPNAPMPKKKK